MDHKVIIEAISLGGSTHRIVGGVKGRESAPYETAEQGRAHLERNGWRVTRIIKG